VIHSLNNQIHLIHQL